MKLNKNELKEIITSTVNEFAKSHADLADVTIEFEEHLPPFEKVDDEFIPILFEACAKKVGVEPDITTFHAGAETHIYANRKNKSNIAFKPVLMGIADVYNMHSSTEKIDIESYKKGYGFLKAFLEEYNG